MDNIDCQHGQLARTCQLCEYEERIAELQKDHDAGRELMRRAWVEFNAIRARDGAPPGVSHEYWAKLTDNLQLLLGDDAQPWMTGAAKQLIAECEAHLESLQNRYAQRTAEAEELVAELESQLDAHEMYNARCPTCGTTHFTLLEDKRCQLCVYRERIAELELRVKEVESEKLDLSLAVVDNLLDMKQRIEELEAALREIAEEERSFLADPIGEAGVTHRKAAIARKALAREALFAAKAPTEGGK